MSVRKSMFVIDLGTSSLRVALLDNEAKTIWMNRKNFDLTMNKSQQDGIAEQDAEQWIQDLNDLMQEAKLWTKNKSEVEAIIITAQRSSIIPVDEKGRAFRNAILWYDERHLDVCQRMHEQIPNLQEITGARMSRAYSAAKILWLKENEKQIYESAYRIFNPQQFLSYRLCGSDATDYSYASRTHLFDLKKSEWSQELLDAFGIDKTKLGSVQKPASKLGILDATWAEQWGLPSALPVYTAGGDQQCSSIALGVIREGSFELTADQGGYLMTISNKIPENLQDATVNAAAIPGCYNLENTTYNCKSVLDNLVALLAPNKSVEEVQELINSVPIGSNDVVVLPLLADQLQVCAPISHRTDILNLTPSNTAADIIHACMESIACEFTFQVEELSAMSGAKADRVLLAGDLTAYKQMNHLLAQLLHLRVLKPSEFESAIYGAWMNIAVQRGIFANYEEALGTIHSQIQAEEIPIDTSTTKSYQNLFQRYKTYRKQKNATLQ